MLDEILLKSQKSLMDKNIKCRKEIEILKSIAEKFIISYEKLQLMLKSQKSIFYKTKINLNFFKK